MLSEKLTQYIHTQWAASAGTTGLLRPRLEQTLSALAGDEALLLKLLYATLPLSDLASVPTETLLSYIRHSLLLREASPFCREVPEDLFLHFVFYPRINSEPLTDCRSFFYELLRNRVEGLTGPDAILEVNRWCCENMTYQTSDERTESPLAAYASGLGRCGEESTFCVTALRSVGIPARQVYVPWWAHCDDNHAWVEAYAEGRWYFLGACEPEPVLNRGWFTDASSRAPMAVCRSFFGYTGDSMAEEQEFSSSGCLHLFNVTARYAETCRLTVRTTDGAGNPVPHAALRAYIVNMADYQSVFSAVTDENGIFSIEIGRICTHLEASAGNLFGMEDIRLTGECCTVTLVLKPRIPLSGTFDGDYIPPAVSGKNRTVLTEAQSAENSALLLRCAEKRNDRIQAAYLREYDALSPEWQEILHLAGTNAGEIYSFLQSCTEEERPYALPMLQAMASKDYRDTPCALLLDHLRRALPCREAAHFVSEVLNPRICYEMTECWRPVLENAFTEEQKAAFREDPQSFMDYIYAHYPDGSGRFYPVLTLQPSAVLRCGLADEKGRRVLFVAGMRTFGVPARIDPADGSDAYRREGRFHCVSRTASVSRSAVIHLAAEPDTHFGYGVNYTLARWDDGAMAYRELDYSADTGEAPEDPFRIPSAAGDYRLMTANRLPNGTLLCRTRYFSIGDGEEVTLPLELRKAKPEEMLSSSRLEAFSLTDGENRALPSGSLITGRTLLLWLEVTKEPTEHILNELIGAASAVNTAAKEGLQIICILREPGQRSDPTLRRVIKAIPDIVVCCDDFSSDASTIARKLFLEPGVWPLVVLTDETHRGYYGTCGYQVGTVELVLKLNRAVQGLR